MNMTATTLPFGQINISHLFTTDVLPNTGRHSSRWQVLGAFLHNAEGTVERLTEGVSGFIVLVGIPGQPNSSMFHIFDEKTRSFYLVDFEFQEMFHPAQFEAVMQHYSLGEYINIPLSEKTPPRVSVTLVKNSRRQACNE